MQAQELPDVLGYPLEEAVLLLKKAGVNYTLQKTTPPHKEAESTRTRVVRQRFQPEQGILQLIIMPEIWQNEK